MLKLFSGTANTKLSQEVAKIIKLPISKSEVVRFGDSEVRVRVEDAVKNQTCAVIQPTSNPTDNNLMELFFFCDALRRQEAKKVIGIIPYFGYARQDTQHREGECVSANVVIRFSESIGFSKIYTIDLHDKATEGVFTIPFKDLSAFPTLAHEVKDYLKKEKFSIISPDQGGIERARKFGEYFFSGTASKETFSLGVIEKRRNLEKLHITKALDLYGDVKNTIAILVDDIITSGITLINAAQLCLDRGAKKVLAVGVHHDFSSQAPQDLQKSPIEKIFTTNTILLKEEQKFSKLKEISVAPLIAAELKTIISYMIY